jgi:hypothetical protein
MTIEEIRSELDRCRKEERYEIFCGLRKEFVIHRLERDLRVPAEVILEAIARSPDLTQRGVRGIIAEAVFIQDVMPRALAAGWKDTTPDNTENPSYDARVSRGGLDVRIQVKTQRLQRGQVLERAFPKLGTCFVTETQRTRSGKTAKGISTRPYRDDEFDVLAVCLFPSTGDWREFRFALVRDLVRRPRHKHLLAVFQPVPRDPNPTGKWSANLVAKLEQFVAT